MKGGKSNLSRNTFFCLRRNNNLLKTGEKVLLYYYNGEFHNYVGSRIKETAVKNSDSGFILI